jgi:meckelin
MYDTISGIDKIGGYSAGVNPEYVRWADDVSLKVEMDMNNQEQIFRPYLIVSYKEKKSNVINLSSTTPVVYQLEYFSDYSDKMESIIIGFIFMNIIAVLITLIRFVNFTKRNPKATM